ncbi:MAG: FtsX-like permease family protein [Bacteroidetes bacterium]|jgi:putative ABC transport system permease protein|nr:FtsX-like permease family protein [Bacteroidota bacterium]
MRELIRFVSLRHLVRDRWRTLLSMVGVALGVAVLVAIRLANHTAFEAFRSSVDVVAGSADLQILSVDGQGFPDGLVRQVRTARGVRSFAPVIETVPVTASDERPFLLLGVDVFSERSFRRYTELADQEIDLASMLTNEGIVLSATVAEAEGVKRGDTIGVVIRGRVRQLAVAGVVEPEGPASAMGGRFGVMDLGGAQRLLERSGTLDRIDLSVEDASLIPELQEALQERLPANVEVVRPASRGEQTEKMLRAFDLNLTALAGIALFVSMFLIYNTVLTDVLRRRKEIGTLRSVGATPVQLMAMLLAEVSVLAVVGSTFGLALGIVLAEAAAEQVAATVTALYVLVAVEGVRLDAPILLQGAIFGFVLSLLAAVPAVREALQVPVRETMHTMALEQRLARRRSRMIVAGCVVLVLSGAASLAPPLGDTPVLGFGSAMLLLVGSAMLMPAFLRLVAGPLRKAATRWPGVEPRLAIDMMTTSLHRSAVAGGALMVAVAMLIGVDTMVGSFRSTVEVWVRQTIRFDLFVSLRSNAISASSQTPVPAEVLQELRAWPAVRTVDTFRGIRIPVNGSTTTLGNVDILAADRAGRLVFLDGDRRQILSEAESGEGVLVSEPFALRRGIGRGDRVSIPTPEGVRSYRASGIFYDYTSDAGLVLMHRGEFIRQWKDSSVTNIALELVDPSLAPQVQEQIERRFGSTVGLLVHTNSSLRAHILDLFDQTFAITYALELIAALIAITGVVTTLLSMVTERQRELGLLKAVGAVPGQIRRIVLYHGALLGVVAAVGGVVTGLALSTILVYVINRQSFGWSIQFSVDPTILVAVLLVIPTVSLLSALWPASIAVGRPVAGTVHYE